MRTVGVDPVSRALGQVLEAARGGGEGVVADYIPQLAEADPETLGIALTSVAGRGYSAGDDVVGFSLQSVTKPFVYALALTELGVDAVHARVGYEPSGAPFNAISLDDEGRPVNPMINAGAIVTTSLIPAASAAERFERILRTLSAFAGRDLVVDEAVYASEAATGDRNRALAHLTRSTGALHGDPEEVVDTYFRQCAVQVDVRDLATMGATLANDGVNPVDGEQVVPARVARLTLSVMSSCGMYDRAGRWTFSVGMPAKSGVSGAIVAVAPGQFGIGVLSPPLDDAGNSARGVAVLTELSESYGLHLLAHPTLAPSPIELLDWTDDGLVVTVRGELGFAEAERVVHDLQMALTRTSVRRWVIDLSGATRVGPVAQQLIAAAVADARAAGIDAELR